MVGLHTIDFCTSKKCPINNLLRNLEFFVKCGRQMSQTIFNICEMTKWTIGYSNVLKELFIQFRKLHINENLFRSFNILSTLLRSWSAVVLSFEVPIDIAENIWKLQLPNRNFCKLDYQAKMQQSRRNKHSENLVTVDCSKRFCVVVANLGICINAMQKIECPGTNN